MLQALEAEEARTAMVRQENVELQKEVEQLKTVAAEFAKQQEKAETAMRDKERDMEQLVSQADHIRWTRACSLSSYLATLVAVWTPNADLHIGR